MKSEGINLLFVGLTGFISVALIQLLTIEVDQVDLFLTIALYCFSMALPLCVFFILTTDSQFGSAQNNEPVPAPQWYFILSILTVLVGFLGIAALFGHFSLTLGIVFLATSVLALIVQDRLSHTG